MVREEMNEKRETRVERWLEESFMSKEQIKKYGEK
jgi:hypothetical protein